MLPFLFILIFHENKSVFLMEEKFNVFISYSIKDKALATSIVRFLESHGLKCFISWRDIPSGAAYTEVLMKTIEQCSCFLLILTKRSNVSDHVRNEIDRAFHRKKNIVVFRTDNIEMSKSLEYFLSVYQWIDAYQFKPSVYFGILLSTIKGLPPPPVAQRQIRSRRIIHSLLWFYTAVTFIVFIILGIPILNDHYFIQKRDGRGVPLIDAIRFSGLEELESKEGNFLPPHRIFKESKQEVFISGITLLNTFQKQRHLLKEALQRGVSIKLLLLNPQSSDSVVVQYINSRGESFVNSMANVFSIIRHDSAFFSNENVAIRFAYRLPVITGIMVDRSVAGPPGKDGIVRFTVNLESPDHEDWVFQFRKTDHQFDAFEPFADEFRFNWNEATSHPEYFK